MNSYAPLSMLKSNMNVTDATLDGVLLGLIEAASRYVDDICNRHFYTETATCYFEVDNPERQKIGDCLSLTALAADKDKDGTFSESWTASHYLLEPENMYPRQYVRVLPYSANVQRLTVGWRYLRATGVWGYGDGRRAVPFDTSAITATVATDSATTIAASAIGILVGQTIRCETEDMYVTAIDTAGTALTVLRGVNGTTAAAHSSKTISVAAYPERITQAVIFFASRMYREQDTAGLQSEWTGSHGFQRQQVSQHRDDDARYVASFRDLSL